MFSFTNIRVGLYLAIRQLRRASKWTTALIVFVMLLTFLNLVVVTGVLVGIVQGITNQFRTQMAGDITVSALDTKQYVEHSTDIISFLKTLPGVDRMSARYLTGATIEANYQTRTDTNDKPNKTGTTVEGIDPVQENNFSHLASYIAEGEYLVPGDYDTVILGSQLVDRYSFGEQPGLTPLKNVHPGTKIRLTVNGNTREVTVKGIIVVPANSPLAALVFMPEGEVRELMNRTDYEVNQIAVFLKPGADPIAFKELLVRSGLGEKAKVQTFEEGIPNGVSEVKDTFAAIGNAISSVGLVVAAITIFIIIFINAITRRKFIGILKGIGVSGEAIELSYIFQSLFYAAIGAGIGLAIIYGFLVPYFSAHPIKLPISNAIIVASVPGTMIRVALLVVTTMIAGYIPARMIVRKNTLDSILGRN